MGNAPLFYAVEVDTYHAGVQPIAPAADAWGAEPWGTLSLNAAAGLPIVPASTDTLRASDTGYRTRPSDVGGVVVYPPYLSSAFAMDRRFNLDPAASATAAAWGSINLVNTGQYDTLAASSNAQGRGVRIYCGRKTWDAARGIYVDPPVASLNHLFTGVASAWFLDTDAFEINLRDGSYWLERSVQTASYSGLGGLAGGVDLTGLPLPKTRGSARSVTPVLVDAVNQIYQFSDHSGSVTALYEGGATGITYAGDVADLYTGMTSPGQYRTCNAKSLFQLGSTPVKTITIDCFGDFVTPPAGSISSLLAIAKWFLLDDMNLPPELLDVASFDTANANFHYLGGFYLGPSATDGATVIGSIVGSIGAKLVPNRHGQLGCFVLRAIPPGTAAVGQIDPSNAVSLTPVALDTTLDPPPYRWQVAWAHCYTVMTSNLSGAITPAMTQYLAAADRFSVAASTSVLTAYRRPSDPAPVASMLATAADALTTAQALLALWSVRRRLYTAVIGVDQGIQYDIGSVLNVVWPADDLRTGRLGQVVAESFRAGDASITFTILI